VRQLTHPPCHARGVPLGSTQRQLVDQQIGQEEMAQVVHSKPWCHVVNVGNLLGKLYVYYIYILFVHSVKLDITQI